MTFQCILSSLEIFQENPFAEEHDGEEVMILLHMTIIVENQQVLCGLP